MPSIVKVTDQSGNVVATREYDAFGNVLSETGDWSGVGQGFHPNWLQLGVGGGNLYLTPGGRIYDTKEGRFLQRDPRRKFGRNPYVAFKNNPRKFVDPSGTDDADTTAPSTYTAQGGETPHDIGEIVGIEPETLIAANPGVDWTSLQPGQKLNLQPQEKTYTQAELEKQVSDEATANSIPPGVLKGLTRQESQWDPKAESSVAAGLMQITENTGKNEMGLKIDPNADPPVDERFDPEKAIPAGAKYLKRLYDRFPEACDNLERWRFAVAAYNAGPGRIRKAIEAAGLKGQQGIKWEDVAPNAPAESRKHVEKILGTSGPVSGFAKDYGYDGQ